MGTKSRTYGDWTVIEKVDSRGWRCLCSCGTEKLINPPNLTSGRSRSCGHKRRVNLPRNGQRYGLWDVLKTSPNRRKAFCRCSCGTRKWVSGYSLLRGDSTSCGHQRRNDGHRRAKLYRIWALIHERCYLTECLGYRDYGARGIYVTEKWHEFENFYQWAVRQNYRVGQGLQIDRINNDGPYSPRNCRWTDRKTNARNKRNTRYLTAFGVTQSVAAWAEDALSAVEYGTLWSRVKAGRLSPEECITLPAGLTGTRYH